MAKDRTPAPTGRRKQPAERLAARRDRRVSRTRCARSAPAASGRPARPADLCARRHHEPPADCGTPPAGCRARCSARRPRSAASTCSCVYYPRARRMPRVALGVRCAPARRPDGADRLPRRPHPDRKDPGARAPRKRDAARCRRWCSSATPWRSRSTISAPRRASSACSACRRSCSRKARCGRRAGVPRDRAADARRLLPVRSRARRMSSPNCCARSRPMPPAASRRSPISRRGTTAARVKLLAQMR